MQRAPTTIAALVLFLAGSAHAASPPRVEAILDGAPLSFEANAGQFDKRAKFVARTPGKTLFLVPEGMVLVLDQSSAPDTAQAVVRIEFRGATKKGAPEGVDRLSAITNYFSAGLAITDVPNFARVRQQDVYGGIDVVYYGNQGQVEYDFIVAPGVDPRRIRLGLAGHDAVRVSEAGALVLKTPAGDLVMNKPVAYQEHDAGRTEVPARYILSGDEVGFQLAAYDPTRPLVIDPVLAYSTFFGGTGGDQANAIALDSSGNLYITGQTGSTNFPPVGAFQTKKAGTTDAFVTKLNASGTAVVYSTYIGGKNGSSFARSIAVDAAGSAYIAGHTTSSAYPVTSGAYATTPGGSTPGLATKLTPLGNALAYSRLSFPVDRHTPLLWTAPAMRS